MGNKYVRYGILTASLSAVLMLSGCSVLNRIVGADDWEEWAPDSTSLQISMDESVTETIVDVLDEGWYTGNELQDMIARSMNEYNEANGAGSISVTSYSDAGGQVKVTIIYRTPGDYSAFNNVPFCAGSMLEAQMNGFLFAGSFCKVDGVTVSGDAIDAAEPLSHKEYRVAISDGTHVVQVPGEIRYVSSNASVLNSHVAQKKTSVEGDGGEAGAEGSADAAAGAENAAGDAADASAQEDAARRAEDLITAGKNVYSEERDKELLYIIYEQDTEPILSVQETAQ